MPLSFHSHTGTAGSCTAPVTLAHALLQVRGAWKSRRPVTCLCSATAGVTQVAAIRGPAAWKAHTTQFPQPSEKPIEQSAHCSDVFMPQWSKQPLPWARHILAVCNAGNEPQFHGLKQREPAFHGGALLAIVLATPLLNCPGSLWAMRLGIGVRRWRAPWLPCWMCRGGHAYLLQHGAC